MVYSCLRLPRTGAWFPGTKIFREAFCCHEQMTKLDIGMLSYRIEGAIHNGSQLGAPALEVT